MQNINKKNLYKLLFIIVLLGFIVSLVGCNWLSFGLLNIFDPQAQIRLNYTDVDLTEGTIDLEVYSLNEVEFVGTGFEYEYYVGTTKITSLSKMVGATFYVAPSTAPGTPGDITTLAGLPLYFQEAQDYMTSNPLVTEMTCTISLIGNDGSGHSISKSVTVDLPALQPGIDFEPPSAVITVTPGTTGTAPFTVVFDGSSSTDNRGIESYTWDFGDGTSGTGVMPAAHTYSACGTYVVKLTVKDYFSNQGYSTVIITVGEVEGPDVNIAVSPSNTGSAPFTVYFDASGTDTGTDCGCGSATFSWNFGDGSTETGISTSHTYSSNGTYIVVLTVTSSEGSVGYGSETITVEVSGTVEAVIETTPLSATGTKPFTIALDASESTTSASGATIATYTWDYDFGTPTTETLTIPVTTHTYTNEGTYLVKLTVTDSLGNIDYAFVSIVVTEP